MTNPIDKRFARVTRYHYVFFGLYFFSRFSSIWHYLNFLFVSAPTDFTCDGILNKCPCSNPVWDRSMFTKTTQIKFGIYCDNIWIVSFTQSFSVFGMVVGSFFFGAMSDRFGRLLNFTLSNLTVATTGCLVSVMPHIAPFIIMRFLEGFGNAGVTVSGYVLCLEYCGIRYRETIATLLHIPTNIGHVALAGVSYLIRNSDPFQVFISIPMFISAAYWFILLESPKWLIDHKRDKAIVVMEKFCKFNKGTDCESIRPEMESYQPHHANKVMKFHHIFKYKKLYINLACMSYLFFIYGLGYYGVSQFVEKMSGDIHINTAVSGAFLAPGSLACIFLMNKFKRKTLVMIANISAGLLIIIVIFIPTHIEHSWIRVIIAGLSNSFFNISGIVNYLYCVELFPTSTRNSAFGFLSTMSRIGQMIGPQINNLPQMAAGLIFGIGAMLGAVVVIPVPETKNTELPTTVEPLQEVPQEDKRNDTN